MPHRPRLTLLVIALLTWGCDSSDDDDTTDDDTADDDTGDGPASWIVEQVEESSVGLQTRLVMGPDDTVMLAYRANEPWEDGICEEVDTDPPPKMRYDLYWARRDGGSWTVELVDSPAELLAPEGHDLALDADGQPVIAYRGGEPQGQYCGANDALLAVREGSSWVFETAATDSGDYVTGEPLSDTGFVVGGWPGLAYDADGLPAIVHKDTHYGNLQSSDSLAADGEFARHDGGQWTPYTFDVGEGAEDYASLLFDTDGRPVAFYAITIDDQDNNRHGVWAARGEGPQDWRLVQLHVGAVKMEVPSAVDPATGDLVVAYYSAADGAVRVRRLSDPALFEDPAAWTEETVGNGVYDEGQFVSLAITAAGNPALSYRRCKLATASGGCDPNDEAVVFASSSAGEWTYETIREADAGSCGEYTDLGLDSTGTPFVAYRCTVEEGGDFVFRLFVAHRSQPL